jgi:predicted RNA polymerase sigma factor
LIERVFRELASMVGYVDDFDLADEAAEEAFAIAEAARDGHDER